MKPKLFVLALHLLKKLYPINKFLRKVKLIQDLIPSYHSPKFEPYHCMQVRVFFIVLGIYASCKLNYLKKLTKGE